MKPSNRSVKSLLIYPAFQLKLLIANVLIMAGISAAIALLVHRSFVNLVAQGTAAHLPATNPYFEFMVYQEKLVMTYLAGGLALAALLSTAAILVLSHKIAGPIVRMRGFLGDVVDSSGRSADLGALPRLTFRQGDFFDDLPAKVNAALEAVDAAAKTTAPDSGKKASA